MVKTTKTLRWRPVSKEGLGPLARRARYLHYQVEILDDLWAPGVPYSLIDWVLAVVASRGSWTFVTKTAYPRRRERYMASLQTRSRGAAEKYEQQMRAHFRRYKQQFTEGYSLPAPPTPELRAIYDSAAKHERRPRKPCGTTLHSGFSLGEFHWRAWPLHNLMIREAAEES